MIVIGPFIAFAFLFNTLNRVETALNGLEVAEAPEQKAEGESDTLNQSEGEEDGDEQNPAQAVEDTNKAPTASAEGREEKTVAPEPRPQPQPQPVYAPSASSPAPRPGEARIRFVPGKQAPANSKWRVCVDKRNKKYRVFATQAEAIAFATKLAASRGVGVKVAGSVAEKPE